MRQILKTGGFEEAVRPELMSVSIQAFSQVESGRTEVLFDQAEKPGPHSIVRQQLEKTSHRARLIPVDELERTTVGVMCSEEGVIPDDLAPPSRIIEFSPIRNPGEIDVDPSPYEWRHKLSGAVYQRAGIAVVPGAASANFVEHQYRGFRDRSW